MIPTRCALGALAVALMVPGGAHAAERATVTRLDAATVELRRTDAAPVDIWVSADTVLDDKDLAVTKGSTATLQKIALPSDARRFLILVDAAGKHMVVAERALPLEQGSNFRDLGGYVTADGRTVKWGRIYRSSAMSFLTERDYAYLNTLGLDSVVDLRALEERQLAPDLLDDRTGAMFLSNDYPLKDLISHMGAETDDSFYDRLEILLVPQIRMVVKRIVAGRAAVVFHDVWGQDRTGVVAALLLDSVGVDRKTIIEDFHLSTKLRRPQFEVPRFNPADFPNNPIVGYYERKWASGKYEAEPLFNTKGASLIGEFLKYIDAKYGGSAAYMEKNLGLVPYKFEAYKKAMLE